VKLLIREFGGLKSPGGVQDLSTWLGLCEHEMMCIFLFIEVKMLSQMCIFWQHETK